MASQTGPNALDRIAGKNPSLVISDTEEHTGSFYTVQLGSDGVIASCTGTGPDGEEIDFIDLYGWDSATSELNPLMAGENHVITSITLSAGTAAVS